MGVEDPADSLPLAFWEADRFIAGLAGVSQWERRTALLVLEMQLAPFTDREIREELGLSARELRRSKALLRGWARTLRGAVAA